MRKWLLASMLIAFTGRSLFAQTSTYPFRTNLFVCVGSNTTIQSSYPNATYLWEVSSDGGNSWSTVTNSAIYSISTSTGISFLTIAPPDVSFNRYAYRCTVTTQGGTQLAPSLADTLIVNALGFQTPQFVNPVTSVCSGSTVAYTVTGGYPNDSIFFSINGGNSNSFSGSLGDSVNLVHFTQTSGTATLIVSIQTGCNDTVPNFTTLPITVNAAQSSLAGTAGGGSDCSSFSIYPGAATTYSNGTCSPIAAVTPSGASPVSGAVQSCVTVDASVQTFNGVPYVPRYYSLEPATNASTSTATITLYFTQADFDAYNTARGGAPALPTGPSDAAGIANLRVSQFHGTGTTPDTYVGTSGTITPSSVTWNSTAGRWEITFDVTGFSGFFVSGGSLIPLPLTLTTFTGKPLAGGNQLTWTTADEENTARFEVERLIAGQPDFQMIGTVAAAGNSQQPLQYSYMDASSDAARQALSYRLRMVDLDGKFTFSPIVTLHPIVNALNVRVSPNPFVQPVSIVIASPAAGAGLLTVMDIDGRKLVEKNIVLQKGDNPLDPGMITHLPQGMYFLRVATATDQQTVRIVKE